uniref:Meis_PKNOX_N domain-containing protein n=1 Tax=Elaeophora elaphi TaxID=1147741 RepID=A0A0R3S4P4_9BILA
MEIEEKDKETLSDQPHCSHHQQQMNGEEEDEVTQPVDKMTLLHQALSQASVTRAKRCKQQRLALSEMKKCDKSNQLQIENRLFQSGNPSVDIFHETGEFMEECSSAIKNHKLFPIVELMSKKCEAATRNLSEASFTMDDVFQQLAEMTSNGDGSLGNSELDIFLINSIIMLRLHLLELEKVAELCDDFKTKYLHTLRKKITQESMIGYNGDSDDDLCNSSPELSEQSKNRTGQQTIAMMSTSKGMVDVLTFQLSIPLWNAITSHSSSLHTSLTQQKISECCSSSGIQIAEKNDVQESAEEESSDSKRKAQLPTKAVELLKTWLFLHSSVRIRFVRYNRVDIHIRVKKKKRCYHEKPAYKWFKSTTGKFRSRMFINARRRILVQSKESADMDFIQEASSNIDCTLIPKRIRRLVVNFL